METIFNGVLRKECSEKMPFDLNHEEGELADIQRAWGERTVARGIS